MLPTKCAAVVVAVHTVPPVLAVARHRPELPRAVDTPAAAAAAGTIGVDSGPFHHRLLLLLHHHHSMVAAVVAFPVVATSKMVVVAAVAVAAAWVGSGKQSWLPPVLRRHNTTVVAIEPVVAPVAIGPRTMIFQQQ